VKKVLKKSEVGFSVVQFQEMDIFGNVAREIAQFGQVQISPVDNGADVTIDGTLTDGSPAKVSIKIRSSSGLQGLTREEVILPATNCTVSYNIMWPQSLNPSNYFQLESELKWHISVFDSLFQQHPNLQWNALTEGRENVGLSIGSPVFLQIYLPEQLRNSQWKTLDFQNAEFFNAIGSPKRARLSMRQNSRNCQTKTSGQACEAGSGSDCVCPVCFDNFNGNQCTFSGTVVPSYCSCPGFCLLVNTQEDEICNPGEPGCECPDFQLPPPQHGGAVVSAANTISSSPFWGVLLVAAALLIKM
jgi:hypothetical protein